MNEHNEMRDSRMVSLNDYEKEIYRLNCVIKQMEQTKEKLKEELGLYKPSKDSRFVVRYQTKEDPYKYEIKFFQIYYKALSFVQEMYKQGNIPQVYALNEVELIE
jgi:hypothetical protein